jgi:hypothetical protein
MPLLMGCQVLHPRHGKLFLTIIMDRRALIRCQRCPVHRPLKKANNVNVGGLRADWTPSVSRVVRLPAQGGRGLHVAPRAVANHDEEASGVDLGGMSDGDDLAERPGLGNVKPVRYYGGGVMSKTTAASRHLIGCSVYLHVYRYALLPGSASQAPRVPRPPLITCPLMLSVHLAKRTRSI